MHHATTLYDETLVARSRAERGGHLDTAAALDGIAAMIAALEEQARAQESRRSQRRPMGRIGGAIPDRPAA